MPAWYFVIVMASSGSAAAQQVGPFANQHQCETAASIISTSLSSKVWLNIQVSPCVQGIVPVLVAVKPETKQ